MGRREAVGSEARKEARVKSKRRGVGDSEGDEDVFGDGERSSGAPVGDETGRKI